METDNISLLLSLNEAIATIQRPEDLMGPIFDKIFKLYNSPVGGICIIENNQTHAFLVFCDTSTRRSKRDLFNSSDNWFGRYSIDELPLELNLRSDDIVQHEALKCISEKPEFDSYRRIVKEYNIEKIIQVPLRCSGNISGFLLFGIAGDNSSFIGEEKLEFIMQFANLIGVGIRNFMNYEELQKRELFQSTLLKITNDFVTIKDRNSMFERLAYEFHNPEIGKSFCNYAEAKLINFFSGDPVLLRFKQGETFKHLTYGSGMDLFSILESLGIKNNEANGHMIIEHDELEQLRQRNANLDRIC
ncbi:MAG: GAF domain-containing protein, partial [Bacteroidota bacterium]|nr:GAF domain-containing protein [Bacteroidota bacterium]